MKKKICTFLLYFNITIYILLLLYALFFKTVPIGDFFSERRMFLRSVNLVPFHSVKLFINSLSGGFKIHAINNLLGNILLFVPMGVYFEYFRRCYRDKKNILISFFSVMLVSVAVEITQYIFGLGVTDVDDVILNTIGGLIGIIVLRIFFAIFKDKIRTAIIIASTISAFLILAVISAEFIIYGRPI